MRKCIILANGQAPKKPVLNFLYKNGYRTLICADGGADTALKLNLMPDYIIGDLDSISANALKLFRCESEIIQIKRQNDTDVEKCLKFAIRKKYEEVILLGGTGDRLDHSFCNLGIVLKFFEKIKIKVLHQKSLLAAYTGKVTLHTTKDEIISIYGIDEKTKIKSSGLKYPINNIPLPFGKKESTSNKALGSEISLRITGGKVFVIRDFNLMKAHGLF